ncbi:MAG: 4-aminobutyrate aminotransferase-like enzyme, partial [Porticoccaceae bacterium]
ETGLIAKVRGEGLVFGIECADFNGIAAGDIANAIVKASYIGNGERGAIHFLGPLAGKVLRVSPPMTMTVEQANDSLALLFSICEELAATGGTA